MKLRIFIYFSVASLLILNLCLAQSKIDQIDELMHAYVENIGFNGAVLVSKGGEIIYNKTFGIADFRTMENIQSDYQFRLASVSKQFTAMGIMILKERGLLNYDGDIRKYFPELDYEGITIRHLLTHTSGLPSPFTLIDDNWDIENKDSDKRKILGNDEAFEIMLKFPLPLRFKPGSQHEYSNVGYMFLSSIIERITGTEFDIFMQENIFQPLGMNSSLIYDPRKGKEISKRVYGFRMSDDGTEYIMDDNHHENGIEGAGGMYSTVDDLYLWDQALYTDKLVSRAAIEEAFTQVATDNGERYEYGFGWSVIEDEEGKIVAHGGGWLGFRTFILREIEDKNCVILLCNNGKMHRGSVAFRIREILHGWDYELPKKSIADELRMIILRNGIDKALSEYGQIKSESPDHYVITETELNKLGYQLLNLKKETEAVEIFKLNVSEYPESFNVYDSLAEAYMRIGENDLAIEYYQKSLEINPRNENARKMLEMLNSK